MDGLKTFAFIILLAMIIVAGDVYFMRHPSRIDMTPSERRADDERRRREDAAGQRTREAQELRREAERREKYAAARREALDQYRVEHPPPTSWPDRTDIKPFDFYLLALSVRPAFCADGHPLEPECTSAGAGRHLLTLRGLWPEVSGPELGGSGDHPQDCSAPRPRLSPDVLARLEEWMPGAASGRHLQAWNERGSCTGLSGDAYFGDALNKTEFFARVAEPQLQLHAGHVVGIKDFRGAIERAHPGYAGTFTLHCRHIAGMKGAQGRATLFEIRVCLDDDGDYKQPGSPLRCDSVNRRDEECGKSFWIPAPEGA